MNDTLRRQLERILAAIAIESPTTFSIAGQLIRATSEPGTQGDLSSTLNNNPLIGQLQQTLYAQCYCQSFKGKLSPTLAEALGSEEDMTELLSDANLSRERWS